jgi:hypothetical protein
VLPTGQYDHNQPINIGNNVVSVNPYYAFAYILTDKSELSVRLHYLWNSQDLEARVGIEHNIRFGYSKNIKNINKCQDYSPLLAITFHYLQVLSLTVSLTVNLAKNVRLPGQTRLFQIPKNLRPQTEEQFF